MYEFHYKDKVRHGIMCHWYENGKLDSESHWKCGLKI